jgi:membrane-associated phospholipid phosphatase
MKKIAPLFVLFFCFSNSIAQNKSITTSGDILQLALPAVALGSTFIWKDDNTKPTWQLIKAYGSGLIIQQALKRIVLKPRPDRCDNYSFPSGHTTSAFSGASFIQKRYGWKYGIPSYVLASFVGYSRIQAKKTRWLGCACRSSNWCWNVLCFYKTLRKKQGRCNC